MYDRVMGAFAGGVFLGRRRRNGKSRGKLATLAGFGIILASLAAPAADALRRLGGRRRTIRVRTSITVARPVHAVFEFCKDFENFPRVVGGLRRVVDYQDGRSHWEVDSPSGVCMEWEAVVTKYVPNSVIAWRSVPASAVDASGLLRFAPTDDAGTRLDIDVSYIPRDTVLADALLALMDEPRQRQLEHDLERLAEYIALLPPKREPGAQAADSEQLTA